MNADLNEARNTPDDVDGPHNSVMNGTSKSALYLRRRVGTGSVAHCLSGSLPMTATKSSTSSVQNADRAQSGGAAVKDDGGGEVSN